MQELQNILSHMGDHAYKSGLSEDTKAQYYYALSHLTDIETWKKVKELFIENSQPYKGMPTIKQLKAHYYQLKPNKDINKHECMYCNSKGLLTAIKIDDFEYLVCCNCSNGEAIHQKTGISRYEEEKHKLKYPFDMELTEKEKIVHDRIKKQGILEVLS